MKKNMTKKKVKVDKPLNDKLLQKLIDYILIKNSKEVQDLEREIRRLDLENKRLKRKLNNKGA